MSNSVNIATSTNFSKSVPSKGTDDDTDTKSRIGDEYILVKKGVMRAAGEPPQPIAKPPLLRQDIPKILISYDKKEDFSANQLLKLSAHRAMARGTVTTSKTGQRELIVDLYHKIFLTSSLNAPLDTVVPIVPANSTEWSALSQLFDQVRVISGHLSWCVNTGNAGSPAFNFLGAISYEASHKTPASAVTEVLEADQHQLIHVNTNIVNNTFSPQSFSKDGLFHFPFKVPPAPSLTAVAVTGGVGIEPNFPGLYASTTDSADSWGYIRTYIEPAGASASQSLIGVIKMRCSFRERQ